MQLHQLAGIQSFHSIGFAIEIYKLDLKNRWLIDLNDGANLAFMQAKTG